MNCKKIFLQYVSSNFLKMCCFYSKYYLPAKKLQRNPVPKKVVLRVAVFLLIIFFIPASLKAATYYLTTAGSGTANTATNWNTGGIGGGGTAASSFTTSGDVFIISDGIAATFGSNTTFGAGVTLQVAPTATLTITNNGATLTINGIVDFASTSSTQVTLAGSGPGNTFAFSGTLFRTANANGVSGTNCSLPASASKKTVTLSSTADYEFYNAGAQAMAGIPSTINNLTLSGSGIKTVSLLTTINGDLTVGSGTTWDNSANNLALTIAGNISNSGSFTAGTGVYTLSGTSKTISGTLTIPSVTVSGSYQNNGTLTVSTALAGAGILTQGATGILNINFTGTPGITTLDASSAGNTVSYGFAGTQTLLGITYHHLTLAGSGVKTMPAGLTIINGNLTLSGTASTAAAATLTIGGDFVMGSGTGFTAGSRSHNVAGNWTNNGGTFTNTGSTINFNGTTQTIGGSAGTTFNNLSTSGATSVSTGIATTISGTLTVGDGTTFTAGAFALTVSGTTTVGGGTSGVLTIASATGTKAFNGDVIVNAGATWNNTAANVALTLPGNISNTGTFNAGTGVYTLSGTSKTISGTLTIPSVTVSGTYQNNGTLTVTTALAGTGTFTQGSNATLFIGGTISISALAATASGNTVDFNGTAAQNIPAVNYYNLTISGNKGNGAITLASSGTIGVAGTFSVTATSTSYIITGSTISFNGTVAQGIPAFNYNNLTITGDKATGSITFANVGTIGVAGTFTASATNTNYVVTNSTFDYNGSGAQTITANVSPFTTYNNLVISNAGVKTILTATNVTCLTYTINGSATLTIAGTGTINVTQ